MGSVSPLVGQKGAKKPDCPGQEAVAVTVRMLRNLLPDGRRVSSGCGAWEGPVTMLFAQWITCFLYSLVMDGTGDPMILSAVFTMMVSSAAVAEPDSEAAEEDPLNGPSVGGRGWPPSAFIGSRDDAGLSW